MIKKLNTFTIDFYSQVEQHQYDGKFTARIASMIDRSKIAVRKSTLCGGMYCVRDDEGKPTGRGIDEETEWMNHMYAYLDTVLVQKPEWFKLEELVDDQLILKIFEEVMKYEGSFRTGGRPKATEGAEESPQGGQGTSAKEPEGSVGGDAPKKVVGREVSAALDA